MAIQFLNNQYISGTLEVAGATTFDTVANPGSDTDKFVVINGSGLLGFRTGAELLADIGGSSSATTVTSVSGTQPIISSGGLTPTISLNYTGANNLVESATDLEGSSIATADSIIYNDATDGNVKKGLISDLPFSNTSGTVTSITPGADSGTGTAITTSGTITVAGGSNITTSVSGTTITVNTDFNQYGWSITDGSTTNSIPSGTTVTFQGGTGINTSLNGYILDIEIDSSVVPGGSGTAGKLVKWTGTKTLGDGPVTISGSDATFAGDITISTSRPALNLTNTGSNPDWKIENYAGQLSFVDTTSSVNQFIMLVDAGQRINKFEGWLRVNNSTNPTVALDVTGSAIISGNATFAGDVAINGALTSNIACTITGNSGYEDIMYIKAAGTNIDSRINLIPTGTGDGVVNATANDLILQTSGADRVTIADASATFAGYIGTGGHTPDVGLEVYGTSNTAAKIKITNTATTPDNIWSIHAAYNAQDLIFTGDSQTVLTMHDSGNATFAGDVSLGDGKKLHFGDPDGDLKIYHTAGGNSYIEESGEGALVFKSSDYYFQNAGGSATELQVTPGTGSTFAGTITASKNQNATSSFTFQNTDTTGTSVRTHLNATAGNRSIRLEAIHNDYSYVVSNNARMYLQTNSGSNNALFLDGNNATFAGSITVGTGNSLIDGDLYFGVNADIFKNSGNLTLDVAGNIILDADGGFVAIKDGGTEIGNFGNSSSNFAITSSVQDKDILFQGNDNGSVITALTLDMSDGGWATFNSGIHVANTFSPSTFGKATFAGTVSGTTATFTTFSGDLNGTINTVTTAVTKGNAVNDTTVATTAFVQNVVGTIPAGLVFQGTWNASTNTPTLASGSGTTGHFYIVSVAGSTNLDGVTDWEVGDWAVFIEQGASDQWEKIDNSSVLGGSGSGGSLTAWAGAGTSVTLTNAPVTYSGNNTTFAGNVELKSDAGNATKHLRIWNEGTAANDDAVLSWTAQASRTYSMGIHRDSGNLVISNADASVASGDLINVNTSGNVGIGITDPDQKLEIGAAGKLKLSRADNARSMLLYTDNSYGTIETDTDPILIKSAHRVSFSLAGSEKVRFQEDGNVGIGSTSTLEGRVDVKMNMASINWTEGNWSEVWDSAGTPGTYFDDAVFHIDTERAGGATGGIVGLAFSPGWQGHQNWGIYSFNTGGGSYSSGDLAFVSQIDNGTITERMRITSAGNVGIGITPLAKLQVKVTTNVNFATSNSGAALRLNAVNDAVDTAIPMEFNGSYYNFLGTGISYYAGQIQAAYGVVATPGISFNGDPDTGMWRNGANVLAFSTAGENRLNIDASGNVGIGTDSPQRKLCLYEDSSGQTQIQFQNSTTGVGSNDGFGVGLDSNEKGFLYNYEGNDIYVETGDALVYLKNSGGNVGIGTNSPGAKLHNYSTATADVFISGYGTAAQNNWRAEHAFFVHAGNGIIVGKANANNDTNRLYTFYNDASGNAEQYIYNTSNTATIKLDSAGDTYFNGGNVGIGTTTPTNGKFVINKESAGTSFGGNICQLFENFNTTDGQMMSIGFRNNNSIGTTAYIDAVAYDQSLGATDLRFSLFSGSAWKSNMVTFQHTGYVGIGVIDPHSYYGKQLVVAAADESGITIMGTASNQKQYLCWASNSTGANAYAGFIAYDHNTNSMQFATNGGSAALTLNSSQNATFAGDVGINTTTSPAKNLVVEGNASQYATIRVLSNSTAHGSEIEFGDSTDADYGSITQFASSSGEGGRMRFRAGGTETMNLSNGNVGIGTALPIEKLQVTGQLISTGSNVTSATAGAERAIMDLSVYSATDHSARFGHFRGTESAGAGQLRLYTDSVERVRIDESGNVGIGKTSPEYNLDVGSITRTQGLINSDNIGEQSKSTVSFTHSTANLNVDVVLGNISFWGSFELTITGSYSNQNTPGKLSKLYAVGLNPNGSIYTNESRVTDSMGAINTNIHLGDLRWDASTSTYRVRVAHIVSTGNAYEIKITAFTQGDSAKTLIAGWSISGLYTSSTTGLVRQYSYFNNRLGIGTTGPTKQLTVNAGSTSGDGINITGSSSPGIFINETSGTVNSHFQNDGGGSYLGTTTSHPMVFRTVNTERMRIQSNGNVLIGTTGATATRLKVAQNVASEWACQITNTAASAYGLAIDTSANTGVYSLGVYTNAGTGFFVKNDGNVGIGTNAPTNTLSVVSGGNLTCRYTGGSTFSLYQNNTDGTVIFSANHGDNGSENRFIWQSGGAVERMRLVDGNLGIGTTSPTGNLTVESAGNQFNIRANTATAGKFWNFDVTSANQLYIVNSANTHYLTIQDTGNVGIGVSAPTANLHVVGSVASQPTVNIQAPGSGGAHLRLWDTTGGSSPYIEFGEGGSTTFTRKGFIQMSSNNFKIAAEYGEFQVWTGTNGSNEDQRLTVTSAGDVLISKTALGLGTVGTELRANGQCIFVADGDNAIDLNRLTNDGGIALFRQAGTVVGSISVTGSATAFNTSSDYRLKEDLQDFKGLDMVSKIPVYDFKWKSDESRSYGVMAHELEEVLPQAVTGEKDAEEMQQVDYSKLVPILLKSIQELEARVKELEK